MEDFNMTNMNKNMFTDDELFENPAKRVPVSLCLDTSYSMLSPESDPASSEKTTRIALLNKGVRMFADEVRGDEIARYAADISVVTFNSEVRKDLEFGDVEKLSRIREFSADGNTHLGEGVNQALDLLEARKKQYQMAGVEYYQPWLVLMTDGLPNGDPKELRRAADRISTMTANQKLTVFPIAIGKDADLEVLRKFAPGMEQLRLEGMHFGRFFTWLSQSVAAVANDSLDVLSPENLRALCA